MGKILEEKLRKEDIQTASEHIKEMFNFINHQ